MDIIEWRCKGCGRLLAKIASEMSIIRIKCGHHDCKTMNAYFMKQPSLMIGNRLITAGTALNVI